MHTLNVPTHGHSAPLAMQGGPIGTSGSLASAALRSFLLVVCSSFALGCDSSGPTPPGPPATMLLVSGDGQQGTVGQMLSQPIVVQVLDANNRGVPQIVVGFQALAGNGVLTPVQASTDANGMARTQWTIGTVATVQSVTAKVENGLGENPVVIVHATALPGPATALAIATEPGSAARSGVPLFPQPELILVDSYNNRVVQAGVRVVAALIDDGSRGLSGTISIFTDIHGRANFADLTITGAAGRVKLAFSSPSVAGTQSSGIDLLAN